MKELAQQLAVEAPLCHYLPKHLSLMPFTPDVYPHRWFYSRRPWAFQSIVFAKDEGVFSPA
jgi:hypothetical protein